MLTGIFEVEKTEQKLDGEKINAINEVIKAYQ